MQHAAVNACAGLSWWSVLVRDEGCAAYFQPQGSLGCNGCSEHVPCGEVAQAVILLDLGRLRALPTSWWAYVA